MNELIKYTRDHTTYEPGEVMDILISMTRQEVIEFLVWNDHNGIYSDKMCKKEGIKPLTEISAKLLAFKILWENNPAPAEPVKQVPDECFTIEISWSVEDVLKQAKEDSCFLLPSEAKEILIGIDNQHDATIGVNWDVISTHINEYAEDKNGMVGISFSTIEYCQKQYTCREIPDFDDESGDEYPMLTCAPEELYEILYNDFGDDFEHQSPVGKLIQFYASPEEMLLDNKTLFDIKN